jgi:hypothetical protein
MRLFAVLFAVLFVVLGNKPVNADPVIENVVIVAYSRPAPYNEPWIVEYGAYIAIRTEASDYEPTRVGLGTLEVSYTAYVGGIVDVQWPIGVLPVGSKSVIDLSNGTLYVSYYGHTDRLPCNTSF